MKKPQTFAEFLGDARRKANLSLRELAGRVFKKDGKKLSPQYLNDIEHGRRNAPEEYILNQLAAALSVDVNVLLSLAGRGPDEVQDYLRRNPEARDAIGQLFRKAKERGFSDWATLADSVEDNKPDSK